MFYAGPFADLNCARLAASLSISLSGPIDFHLSPSGWKQTLCQEQGRAAGGCLAPSCRRRPVHWALTSAASGRCITFHVWSICISLIRILWGERKRGIICVGSFLGYYIGMGTYWLLLLSWIKGIRDIWGEMHDWVNRCNPAFELRHFIGKYAYFPWLLMCCPKWKEKKGHFHIKSRDS